MKNSRDSIFFFIFHEGNKKNLWLLLRSTVIGLKIHWKVQTIKW